MTPKHTSTTSPMPPARVAPSGSTYRQACRARHEPRLGLLALRAKIMAAVAVTLATVAFFVVAPAAVTIPVLTVLLTALVVAGLFAHVARLTRSTPAAPWSTVPATDDDA
jgi:hypothetical protein